MGHRLQAGLLGPRARKRRPRARFGQQEQGPGHQGDQAGEEEEDELLRKPQPQKGGRDEAGHFPPEHLDPARGWGTLSSARLLRSSESRHLSAAGLGERKVVEGAPPWVGVPEVSPFQGLFPGSGFGESPLPAPGQGGAAAAAAAASAGPGRAGQGRLRGPGPARSARAPPSLRPPRHALLAAAGARGRARAPSRAAAAAGARHMPSEAPRLVPRGGAPAGLVPEQAALSSPPTTPVPKFEPQKQFPEGSTPGGWGSDAARLSGAALRARWSSPVATAPQGAWLSRDVHNFAPPRGGAGELGAVVVRHF